MRLSAGGIGQDGYRLAPAHALPPNTELVGREDELTELVAMIDRARLRSKRRSGIPVMVSITGAAGVGKSALAIALAYDLTSEYPDGILYADLRDAGQAGELDISQKQREFLQQLGARPAELPSSASLDVEFRGATKDKRVLVFLDNVSDYGRIQRLVPNSPTCLVICTSLNGPGDTSEALPLKRLDKDEALELFELLAPGRAARSDKEADLLRRVLDACDGLPIAIGVLAARLKDEPGYALSELLDDLDDHQLNSAFGPDLEDAIYRCFRVGYDALSDAESELFRALSVAPGVSFDVTLAARIFRISTDKASRELNRLKRLQLIQGTKGHGYFTMHSLLREFGKTQLDEQAPWMTRRVLAACRDLAGENDDRIRSMRTAARSSAAADRVERSSDERDRALDWMEKQHQNLVAAVRVACDGDGDLVEIAWQLCRSMVEFFEIRGTWAAWRQTHEEALAVVPAASIGHAFLSYGLGRYYGSQRDWAAAVGHYRAAISIFRKEERHGEVRRCLNYLGDVYRYMRNWDAAQNCFAQSLSTPGEADHPRQVAVAMRSMAAIARLRGEFDEAASLCVRAIEILEREHDDRWIAATKLSLADIYLDSADDPETDPDQLQRARDLLEQSLRVFEKFRDSHWLLLSRRSLGETLRKQGQYAEALVLLEECTKSLAQARDPHWQGEVRHSFGLTYLGQGDLVRARIEFAEAEAMFRTARDVLWEGRTYVSVGRVHAASGELEQALDWWLRAWPLLVEQGASADLRRLNDDLADAQQELAARQASPDAG